MEDRVLNLVTDFDYTQEEKDAFATFANQPMFADTITILLNGDFIGGRPKRH
jgi:hypothetical protein